MIQTVISSKENELRKTPIIESKVYLSEDGRYVVHKTTIMDIKPVSIYKKIILEEKNYD